MEHRFHPRRELQTEVTLYHRGEAVAICTTRNISLGGMLVHTAPLRFCKNLPLELELRAKPFTPGTRLRLSAFVVHDQGEGTGLMFHQLPTWARQMLSTVMRDAGTTPAWEHNLDALSPEPPVLLLRR